MDREVPEGYLRAAKQAGAHDEYIAFVAEYPESKMAAGLETAISMNTLDDAQGFMSSFEYSLFSGGVENVSNPDKTNTRLLRELFGDDRVPDAVIPEEDQ